MKRRERRRIRRKRRWRTRRVRIIKIKRIKSKNRHQRVIYNQETFHMHCYKTFRRIPPPSPDDAGLILLGRGK